MTKQTKTWIRKKKYETKYEKQRKKKYKGYDMNCYITK